jgi:hypothetical protein
MADEKFKTMTKLEGAQSQIRAAIMHFKAEQWECARPLPKG